MTEVCGLCGQPAWSRSEEHDNVNLCVLHYRRWLKKNKCAVEEIDA